MNKLIIALILGAATTPALKAKVLIDPAVTGSQNAALDTLEADAGASVPTHTHEGSDELLYILEGKAVTTINGQEKTAKAGDTVFIPKGAAHSAKFLEKTRAVQVYAPAGPEQRFK